MCLPRCNFLSFCLFDHQHYLDLHKTYALCRQLEGYDEIVVDRLMEIIAKEGYRMQTLITEIVTSYPFTQRRIQ